MPARPGLSAVSAAQDVPAIPIALVERTIYEG